MFACKSEALPEHEKRREAIRVRLRCGIGARCSVGLVFSNCINCSNEVSDGVTQDIERVEIAQEQESVELERNLIRLSASVRIVALQDPPEGWGSLRR